MKPLFLIAAVTLAAAAHADSPLRKDFQAEHDRQVRAFNRKDVDGFMAHYADALTVAPLHGPTMDRAGWRRFIAAIVPGVRRVDIHRHRIVALTADGDRWRARIEEKEAYDIVDTAALFGKKGKRHYLTNDSTYDEVWTKTQKGWRVQSVTMVSEKQTLDKKPVDFSQ